MVFNFWITKNSDNGLEFKNKTMIDLIKKWDGDCKCVYGRPRHPQSQGLIEQANGTEKNMIAAMMEQGKTKEWSTYYLEFNLIWILRSLLLQNSCHLKFFLNKKPNFGTKKEFVDTNKDGNEVECIDNQQSTALPDTPLSSNDLEDLERVLGFENNIEIEKDW